MEFKKYKTPEEAREAFTKAIQMRSIWERSVREKWSKEKAEAHGLRTIEIAQ